MKFEELKALESEAPMPWTFDGQFSALYGPDDLRLAEIEWISTGPLAAALRNLAPEILALVEAARWVNPANAYGEHEVIGDVELREALDAFNAKLEAL